MGTNIQLTYSSQWDPDASEDHSDDCGPTCIKMILNHYGENFTINQVFDKTGALPQHLLSFSQLFNAISAFDYKYEYLTGQTEAKIKSLLDQGILCIALVHNGSLATRQDQKDTGGHFVVPVQYDDLDRWYLDDPDFWGQYRSNGDHHNYPDFLNAWGNCTQDGNPNNTLLVIYPKNAIIINPPVSQPVPAPQPQPVPPVSTSPSGSVSPSASPSASPEPSGTLPTSQPTIPTPFYVLLWNKFLLWIKSIKKK